jgi:hypothetical protein
MHRRRGQAAASEGVVQRERDDPGSTTRIDDAQVVPQQGRPQEERANSLRI